MVSPAVSNQKTQTGKSVFKQPWGQFFGFAKDMRERKKDIVGQFGIQRATDSNESLGEPFQAFE